MKLTEKIKEFLKKISGRTNRTEALPEPIKNEENVKNQRDEFLLGLRDYSLYKGKTEEELKDVLLALLGFGTHNPTVKAIVNEELEKMKEFFPNGMNYDEINENFPNGYNVFPLKGKDDKETEKNVKKAVQILQKCGWEHNSSLGGFVIPRNDGQFFKGIYDNNVKLVEFKLIKRDEYDYSSEVELYKQRGFGEGEGKVIRKCSKYDGNGIEIQKKMLGGELKEVKGQLPDKLSWEAVDIENDSNLSYANMITAIREKDVFARVRRTEKRGGKINDVRSMYENRIASERVIDLERPDVDIGTLDLFDENLVKWDWWSRRTGYNETEKEDVREERRMTGEEWIPTEHEWTPRVKDEELLKQAIKNSKFRKYFEDKFQLHESERR